MQFRRPMLKLTALAVVAAALTGCSREVMPTPAPRQAAVREIRTLLEQGAGGPGGAATAPVPKPTGAGTLLGVVKYVGSPPDLPRLSVTKDEATCAPGGAAPKAEFIVLGDSVGSGAYGLANVAIFLDTDIYTPQQVAAEKDAERKAAMQEWVKIAGNATKTATVEFDQEKCMFTNRVAALQTTQKMIVLNSDPVTHNATLPGQTVVTPKRQPGQPKPTAEYTPSQPTSSPKQVTCNYHPWMKAFVLVRENPYFDVTRPNGEFRIENLPAGVELEFRIWHEQLDFIRSVRLNGEEQKLSKGRFTVTLEPGQEQRLEFELNAAQF